MDIFSKQNTPTKEYISDTIKYKPDGISFLEHSTKNKLSNILKYKTRLTWS